MHDMKADRQIAYGPKRKDRSRNTFTPIQQVGFALSIRHSDRNNEILKLLSAPNYGITITPRETLLYETMIANAVSQIAKNEGVYIPPNLQRGVRISFHIDNYDEQMLTFDGKNTVHYLLICYCLSNTADVQFRNVRQAKYFQMRSTTI